MFLVASRFSSPISPIGLGSFSPGSHFSLQRLPRSTKLASKERGNCNNVTLGAEGSRSESHVTISIQNFTLVSLTSTTTLHRVWLSFGASGPFLDLRTRLLLILCTQSLLTLRTQLLLILRTRLLLTLRTRPLTVYAIENGWTSMRNDPLWYYLQIVHLSKHEARSSSDVT